jgi:hypothetical protein
VAGVGDEREELLDGGIAEGDAADGDVLAVDEDVAAEARAAVARRHLPVERVRIAHLHGEVIAAVRVQMLDPVNPLGHLVIALPQLRPGVAAGGEDRIVADEAPLRRRSRP